MYWSVRDDEYGTSAETERVVIEFSRRLRRPRRVTRPALLHAALPTATVAAVVALISLLAILAG